MTLKERIDLLVRLHLLIKRKSAGGAKNLAHRLQLSEPTVYHYLDELRSYDAPIIYFYYR